MEQPLKRNFVLSFFIILVSYVSGHKGCFEEERKGLLELKEIMGFMNQSSIINNEFEFLLSDWVDIEGKDDCCEWSRITCNHTTGHVIKISLGEMYRYNVHVYDTNLWSLNLSLFLPFKELQSLNLSFSHIDGWTKNKGLTSFSHLEILDLSENYFGGSIPSFIWELSALKALYLSDIRLNESLPMQGMTSLPHLEILDLGGNDFGGSFPSFIWKLSTLKALYLVNIGLDASLPMQGLTSLPHLEILDLSLNYFGRSIPSFIWELSTLKALYLRDNEFDVFSLDLTGSRPINGTLHNQGLTYLPHLEILDLSENYLGGSIPSFIWELSSLKALYLRDNNFSGSLPMQGFASLHHLEILDLSENRFGGSIPPSIWSLSSLKVLSLSRNELNGSLPVQGFCEQKKLQELDFGFNNLEGTLPPCLNNLTSLRVLDLFRNRFNGNISSSLIASLAALEYIDLSYNNFEGLFSFSSFANHSKLQVVEIQNDNPKFEVETESINWIPLFQLKSLVLSNCNLNKVPKFLFHQQRLSVLDLSENLLDGRFPSWLLENNTELDVLILRNNSFSGLFHLPPFRNLSSSVRWMDISNNHLDGEIHANIGKMLPHLHYLNLSRNDFHNGIPSSIGDLSELEYLDLSVNHFSGEFPNQVATGCTSLRLLVLSHNRFHGEFPLTQFNELSMLKLDNNQFTGKLSNDFTGFNYLYALDISNNFFSGKIPMWIFNIWEVIVLRNNSFEGKIAQLPFHELLTFVDFSHNSFSGSLPPFTKNTGPGHFFEHLHLQGNKFTGSIPESYVNLSRLLTLDLSDNNLSGSIPKFIGSLSNLRILLLRDNCFSGFIPNQLCYLRNISLMDLSYNSLSGSIPKCLPNITGPGPGNPAFSRGDSFGIKVGYDALYIYERNITTLKDTKLSMYKILDEVDFLTKGRPNSYKGSILDFMTGLDLSHNNLSGEIPIQIGMLDWIHALNLSHNQLIGSIPKHFSHLAQMESLDLSFNSLSGEIPLELVNLTFLEVFVVAHNNLSGSVPEMKAQFGTFLKESFEGNPFLCGPQVEKNCTPLVTPSLTNESSDKGEEKWYEIDLVFFCASFVTTYFVFLLGAAIVLYINPYWRRRWFNLVEECMYSCYYFLCDSMRK